MNNRALLFCTIALLLELAVQGLENSGLDGDLHRIDSKNVHSKHYATKNTVRGRYG